MAFKCWVTVKRHKYLVLQAICKSFTPAHTVCMIVLEPLITNLYCYLCLATRCTAIWRIVLHFIIFYFTVDFYYTTLAHHGPFPRSSFTNDGISNKFIILSRLACLQAVILVEAWMAWNFIVFQVKRFRECSNSAQRKNRQEKKKGKKDKKSKDDTDADAVQNGSPKAGLKQE